MNDLNTVSALVKEILEEDTMTTFCIFGYWNTAVAGTVSVLGR